MARKDNKKPRFFGHPEIFGDGSAWAYIGDTPEQVKSAFEMVKDAETHGDVNWNDVDGELIIKVQMMTDKQVKALPEL